MRVVNADQLRKACAKVRDDLSDPGVTGALIFPLACDVIASSPALAGLIIQALETVSLLGEP